MKPLVQIVDDNDVIIGHKKREDIHPENDIYRVTALWVINSDKQILIAQRSLSKANNPGKWGMAVNGTVEDDETYEENVYKEAEEEIGLTNAVFRLGPKVRVTSAKNFFVQIFTAVVDWDISRFKIQEEEVERIMWISPDDLIKDFEEFPQKYTSNFPRIVRMLLE